jgi:uncharacterized iron-regulated membrane protein
LLATPRFDTRPRRPRRLHGVLAEPLPRGVPAGDVAVSNLTPTPFSERTPTALDAPIAPRLALADALALGRAEAARRGWETPVGAVGYSPRYGIHSVRFFQPGDDHGAAGVGPAMLYVAGPDGRYLGDRQPWKGTAADIFVQARFPLHSGRILGLPGRILISAMGLAVAALSVTGVVIWWRKRRARVLAAERRATADARPAAPLPAE